MNAVKLICVGKMKEKYFKDAASEYIKRLGAYCKPEILELPEEPIPADAGNVLIKKALDKESDGIFKALNDKAFICALCVEGKQLDSVALAEKLNALTIAYPRFIFIIGGSNGLSEAVKKRADLKLSMSEMTFPHHLARVMLLEQIYRAFKISEGSGYHK